MIQSIDFNFEKLPPIATYENTVRIVEIVKPYFLAPYSDEYGFSGVYRFIEGDLHIVERPNHGLAHSLRQGALAKDIFNFLTKYSKIEPTGIVKWAQKKCESDPFWIFKIEMAASFQRAGRQAECSQTSNLKKYLEYEMQDATLFRKHARDCLLFKDEEVDLFAEAILWTNQGRLDQNQIEDLKFLKRIFHAAHTLDLRRMLDFDGERIQNDAMNQLMIEDESLKNILWSLSGEYLEITGDRDLVTGRTLQDKFFTQSRDLSKMVEAINQVYWNRLTHTTLSF